MLPFERDIPYYPEFLDPLTGEIIPVEDRKLPTESSSIFMTDPNTMRYAEILATGLSPSASPEQISKSIKKAKDFFGSSKYPAYYNFFHYAQRLRNSAVEREDSPRNHKRQRQIGEVVSRLYPPRSANLEIPKPSSERFPREIVELANRCFRLAYPCLSDLEIADLRFKDVLVIDSRKLSEFSGRVGRSEAHSFLLHTTRELYDPKGSGGVRGATGNADFFTLPPIGHRTSPTIVFPSGFLSELPPIGRKYIAGRFLIHERIHHLSDRQLITVLPDDPLIDIALSEYDHLIEEAPDYKNYFSNERQFLKLIAKTQGEAGIEINGAYVSLFLQDVDGVRRRVMSSGYDINEALAEWLINPVIDQLIKIAQDEEPSIKKQIAICQTLLDTRGTALSTKRKSLYKSAPKYLELLGYSGYEDALVDFINGNIPKRHIERIPTQIFHH